MGLAVLATFLVLLGIEVATRASLSAGETDALPQVGVGVEDLYRAVWLERRAQRMRQGGDGAAFRWDMHDPLLGWRPRPHIERRHVLPGSFDVIVRTNETGLRGTRAFAVEKPPGWNRVAIFGCSQTFGGTIDEGETYADRLAASLVNVEVLNFGVHGYGTDQMLLRLQRDGLPYAPDIVVLGFAAYHMERNALGFRFYGKPRFVLEAAELKLTGVPIPSPDELATRPPPAAPAPLADRSVFVRWIWGRLLEARISALQKSGSPGWPVTKALVERFAHVARERGMTMVLLNLEDVDPDIEARLDELAGELDVGFVNLGPEFRRLRRAGRSYRHRGDFHWTPDGHRIIADALRAHLCTHALVDCGASGAQ